MKAIADEATRQLRSQAELHATSSGSVGMVCNSAGGISEEHCASRAPAATAGESVPGIEESADVLSEWVLATKIASGMRAKILHRVSGI